MIPEEIYKSVEEEYERLLKLFPHASKKFLMDLAAETILGSSKEKVKELIKELEK